MGHKVNPVGLRLGINRTWDSRWFAGDDYAPAGRIDLGEDADNVRVDVATNTVFVGYGAGALAVIDPATARKTGDIRLAAHPDGMIASDIGAELDIPPSTRSHHLEKLNAALATRRFQPQAIVQVCQ